jgi:hypothetical protein
MSGNVTVMSWLLVSFIWNAALRPAAATSTILLQRPYQQENPFCINAVIIEQSPQELVCVSVQRRAS